MSASRAASGAAMALSVVMANPEVLGIVAAVAGTAIVGALVYEAYEHEKKAAIIEQIKHVQLLYEEHLAKITVGNEQLSFPPIFKYDEKDKSKAPDVLHLTIDMIQQMGQSNTPTVPELKQYKLLVLRAITALKQYYFLRVGNDKEKAESSTATKTHDVSSVVLSYLLQMLVLHVQDFQGYEYDVAYLAAISKFVNEYGGKEESQHFSMLNPVYQYLKKAKKALDEHKKHLSLTESTAQLSTVARVAAEKFMKSILKGILPENQWQYVPEIIWEDVLNGRIRKKHNTRVLGMSSDALSGVKLADSKLARWLKSLVKYYFEVQAPEIKLTADNFVAPEQLFIVPDFDRLKELQKISKKNISKTDKAEIASIEADIKDFVTVFTRAQNFITYKKVPHTGFLSKTFVVAKDYDDLKVRIPLFRDLAYLAHMLISMQCLPDNILTSEDKLGSVNMTNPHHFHETFILLDKLYKKIVDLSETANRVAVGIEDLTNDEMQVASKTEFYEEVCGLLENLGGQIKDYKTHITELRDKAEKNPQLLKQEKTAAKVALYVTTDTLYTGYHIPKPGQPHPTVAGDKPIPISDAKHESDSDDDTDDENISATTNAPSATPATTPNLTLVPVPIAAIPPLSLTPTTVPTPIATPVIEQPIGPTSTAVKLSQIETQLESLAAEPDISQLRTANIELNKMHLHALTMKNENVAIRNNKGTQFEAIIGHLCDYLLGYLQSDKDRAAADKLIADVTGELPKLKTEYNLVDKHNSLVKRLIPVFTTDAHAEISRFLTVCQGIGNNKLRVVVA